MEVVTETTINAADIGSCHWLSRTVGLMCLNAREESVKCYVQVGLWHILFFLLGSYLNARYNFTIHPTSPVKTNSGMYSILPFCSGDIISSVI